MVLENVLLLFCATSKYVVHFCLTTNALIFLKYYTLYDCTVKAVEFASVTGTEQH